MKFFRHLFFLAVISPVMTHAALIDQSNLYTTPIFSHARYAVINSADDLAVAAQTFTVGLTGTLDSIALQVVHTSVMRPQEIMVSIHRMGGDGQPASDALASVSYLSDGSISSDGFNPTTLPIDFSSAGLAINEGDELAIVLTPLGPALQSADWLFDADGQGAGNPYAQGDGMYRLLDGTWGMSADFGEQYERDFGFATYVTPIPLPGAFVFLFSGIAALVVVRFGSRVGQTDRLSV